LSTRNTWRAWWTLKAFNVILFVEVPQFLYKGYHQNEDVHKILMASVYTWKNMFF
jgi:hypothetical protein